MEGSNNSSSSSTDGLSNEERLVVQELYDGMMRSICVDVACGVHRDAGGGGLLLLSSSSDRSSLSSRLELYPHANEEMARESLSCYATDQPLAKRLKQHDRVRPAGVLPPQQQQPSSMVTRNQQSDVWGRNPPKEPKSTASCLLCGREFSVLRFAPHLDKCMGIGTTVRAAAANNSAVGLRTGMK